MFRRRTDQVYATLQQVQRRISEQSGQPPAQRPTAIAPAVRSPMPQPAGAPPRPAARITTPLPADGLSPQPHPSQVAPAPQAGFQPSQPPYLSTYQPAGIQLTVQSAVTLALVVVLLCGGCFGLGWWAGSSDRPEPANLGSRPQVDPPARVEEPQQQLFVIVVHAENNTANLDKLRSKASQFDTWIADPKQGSWPRGFGVRTTVDGGVQLYYGLRPDGSIGVPSTQRYKELAALLAKIGLKVTWEKVKI